MGHAELAPPFFSVGIDIDADDHVGARHLRALKHVEADAAETENDDIVAGNDLRRVHDCADASGGTATDIEAGLERRGFPDCRNPDLGQDGEAEEGCATHEMEDDFPFITEACRTDRCTTPAYIGRALASHG